MSLNSAMLSGVAGLSANSTSLSVTSSNISNSNTIGFKGSSTSFATLLAGQTGTSSATSVKVDSQQEVSSQGELASADSTTDMAIDGDGFFITEDSNGDTYYTRAGDFSTDEDFNLVNSSGLYLQGYEITTASDGTETTASTLSNISLDNTTGISEESTALTVSGNLDASTTASSTADGTDNDISDSDYTTTMNVYDSLGGVETLTLSFVKSDTNPNEWTYNISSTSSNITGDTDTSDGTDRFVLGYGTITFNSDGSLASITADGDDNGATLADSNTSDGSVELTIPYTTASGLASQTISLDFGTVGDTDGFSQFASDNTSSYSTDGAAYGTVSSYSISETGTITATYSNGLTRDLYAIPLATFANPDGLTAISGTAFTSSDASGDPSYVTAGSNGAGQVESGYLESSTVDLADELTDLISTQRAYQACAKIVTTTTNMLDVLVQLGS